MARALRDAVWGAALRTADGCVLSKKVIKRETAMCHGIVNTLSLCLLRAGSRIPSSSHPLSTNRYLNRSSALRAKIDRSRGRPIYLLSLPLRAVRDHGG